uniref:Ribonuclease H-like domain-containing protein n=1 Tax=Tanacetum cinerariifolium TaxID=118510 RepID=A0A6L2L5Y0_TANCI|nr:ribonuclease H-like domain-containing protein [Tanacetum cinerariifolium]
MYGSVIFNVINEIHGLNDVYQNIRSNILAIDHLLDVRKAFNVVSIKESHKGLHLGTRYRSGNKVQLAAFVVKSNIIKGNEPRWGNNNSSNRGPIQISYVKIIGKGNSFGNSNGKVYNNYTKTPKGASTSSGSISFDTQFTKEQMMKIISLINDKPSGNANANMAEKISTIWSVSLTANVVLFDVLVILDYNVNLMFVHKLIKDSKLFVRFDEIKCYIQDLNLVRTLGIGSEVDGLYLFGVKQMGKFVVGVTPPNRVPSDSVFEA